MSSPLKHDVEGGGAAPDSRAEELALEAADQKRADERERKMARRRRFIEQLQGEGLILVLIVVFVLMWISSPFFLTQQNLLTAASVISVLGVMAVAETLLVISGEIDISIGSVMAATSVLMGVMVSQGLNVWLAAVIGLLFASSVGVVNGIITVYFKINSLVTTLGTYSIFLGVAYAISNTAKVSIGGSGFQVLGSGQVGSIAVPVFFLLGLWLLGLVVAALPRWGGIRHRGQLRRPCGPVSANMLRMGLFIATR
jgi:ribose/xylose/arabinose/galactoside ABC-type transport system permease subunit